MAGNPLITEDWDNVDFPWREEHLQAAMVQTLYGLEREGWLSFAADMNAGKRGPRAAAMAKATGIRSGEPDLRIYLGGGRTIFIELKRRGGRMSHAQTSRVDTLNCLGFPVYTLYAACPSEACCALMGILRRLRPQHFGTNEEKD